MKRTKKTALARLGNGRSANHNHTPCRSCEQSITQLAHDFHQIAQTADDRAYRRIAAVHELEAIG